MTRARRSSVGALEPPEPTPYPLPQPHEQHLAGWLGSLSPLLLLGLLATPRGTRPTPTRGYPPATTVAGAHAHERTDYRAAGGGPVALSGSYLGVL